MSSAGQHSGVYVSKSAKKTQFYYTFSGYVSQQLTRVNLNKFPVNMTSDPRFLSSAKITNVYITATTCIGNNSSLTAPSYSCLLTEFGEKGRCRALT